MPEIKGEPRPLIPAPTPFYERAIPLSWALVRFAVGWFFSFMPERTYVRLIGCKLTWGTR
jgi:hypothetical protein